MLVLAACAPVSQPTGMPEAMPSPAGDWTLRLTQSGGFAGVKLNVQVSSDGRLTADDQRTGRSVSQTLPPEAVAQVASQLAPMLRAAPARLSSPCADCFHYRLELTSEGKTFTLEADDTALSDSGAAGLVALLQQLRDRALRSNP